jgi:hypothetical protein
MGALFLGYILIWDGCLWYEMLNSRMRLLVKHDMRLEVASLQQMAVSTLTPHGVIIVRFLGSHHILSVYFTHFHGFRRYY